MSERSLETIDAIQHRRSVRAFKPDAVPRPTIERLLGCAVRAPTAMHREPWVFAVIQDRVLLRALSDRTKERWRTTAPKLDPHVIAALPEARGFYEALSRPDFNVFYDAGTLILVCVRPLDRFVTADGYLAAENLMLAAEALGLGTCLVGGAIDTLSAPEVKLELGLPLEIVVLAPIIVGVPAHEEPPTSRREPQILFWR
jgi:nitroreductase